MTPPPSSPGSISTDPSGEQTHALFKQRVALVGMVGFLLSLSFLLTTPVLSMSVIGPRLTLRALADSSTIFHSLATVVLGAEWLIASQTSLRGLGLVVLDFASLIVVCSMLALMGGTGRGWEAYGMFHATLAICAMLTTHAIAIPSTARRTLVACIAASAAAIVSLASALALSPTRFGEGTSSAGALVINMTLWLAAFSALATFASRVIYGLRAEVREAKRLGQYMLHEKLGEGGMGIVYRATHAMLRRDTAIKLLPQSRVGPEAIARFEREVRQTARLASPNTVAIYDYGRTPDGLFYYAMEYLDGLSLNDLVEAVGPLPPGRVVHILQQVCGSLAEAHEIGLVHRDVKPGNAVIAERGGVPDVVKVLDFGLVKDLRHDDDVNLTAEGSLTGTPLYLAPESIRDPVKVGPSSDLYAVAAVGYYLLTATHVFKGRTVLEVCAAQLHTTPERPSARIGKDIPTALEDILLRGLSKEPEKRPASAREMREALLASEVQPWTEKDATLWWSSVGRTLLTERTETRTKNAASLASTIAVDLERR